MIIGKTLLLARTALCAVFVFAICESANAQSSGKANIPSKPVIQQVSSGGRVIQIDSNGLKRLLKPNGKPLLVNFWATWCDPCREEFPDIVKLDRAYKGRLDIITISLDDIEDIDTTVPKFLRAQKAEMPAYLLRTPDESAAIQMVAADWSGSLPLTVLYTARGARAYLRMGKIRLEKITPEIEKLLGPATR